MRKSPLEDPRLSEIEAKLNAAKFDEAQRLLAALSDVPSADVATVYFATRLLFHRGRLDASGVVERLRELLRKAGPFPEAEQLLKDAEQGVLAREDEPGSSSAAVETMPQNIPRAPPLPRFTPNPSVPSYIPSARATSMRSDPKAATVPPPSLRDTELSPPPPPPDASLRPKSPKSHAANDGSERAQRAATHRVRQSERRARGEQRAKLPTIPELEVPSSASSPTLRAAVTSIPAPTETIRSPPPPASTRSFSTLPVRAVPTLFEIAHALDAGKAADALELAERLDPIPEVSLLRARAQAQLGKPELARVELDALLRAPTLEPALRTGVARLLIELGFPERALEQARQAFEEDSRDARTRVTCAWALLRLHRRRRDERLVSEAEPLLASVRLREKALVAVLSGLRALMALERGDPRRALGLAQSALSHNARQPDALIALAVASARLGLVTDAQRAADRLLVSSPVEAEAARPLLGREGVELCRSEPPVRATENRLVQIWGAAEAALVHGRREPAMLGFERACAERLRAAERSGKPSFAVLTKLAAELFTTTDVLRHFAPYDCSLFSVERLAAAFDVLYGTAARQSTGDDAVIRLAGAYVGESLRQAFGGEWNGTPKNAGAACVEAIGFSVYPYELVALRLRHGESLVVPHPARLHPGADPLGNSAPLSLVPPCPWDPEPWPPVAELSELGRVLPDSVVGVYCAPHPEVRLDHSVSSSVGIDRYVALLAPAKAPPDAEAGWARRAAVLVGAYLGEVLVEAGGARWEENAGASGPERYRLVLKTGTAATPVARAFERLSGRRSGPLSDYVTRLVSGRASTRA